MNFTHLDVDHLISSELSSSASYFMQLISNHLLTADSPQDGQDLLYSYRVPAMMPISFLNTEDLVNYGCKEIEQLTTPENTITYHNALCLLPQIVNKHCVQFLLGVKIAPRETENNAYTKFWGGKKKSTMVCNGICD